MEKYQTFLEKMRNASDGDYNEIVEIRNTHKILANSRDKLIQDKQYWTDKNEDKRIAVNKYEKAMN